MANKSVLKNVGKGTGQREVRPVWKNAQRINHQNKFVPSTVLTRSGRVPVNTAKKSSHRAAVSTSPTRLVNTAIPNRTLNVMILNKKVNTVRVNGVNTDGQAVSVVKGNGDTTFKTSAGNKDFLTDYQEYDGGFVAFGGSTRGGRISGKGKIRTNNLDFEDVYFVKELKFNLFSVSQMCDKKNNVLFTESECLILSPNFKLVDESQILLRVPRQDNMYNFDLKDIVPSGGLTCLFAKAIIDESKLWHRRLGHVNFKTMNKLVKGNLVRGLPSIFFENDHTCVACQKGKQHKASLTDDFSRFSWVFFLASKGETSGILKRFIIEVKNQLNHKVKVIRSDNGTEFKNKEMDEFCGHKGIKREFSVAKTLQQNRVAERKNRTLIKATRTMLADSLLPTIFWAEAVNTTYYVLNRVLVTKSHNKTPYELIIGRPPCISFMRPFGCLVTILNTLDPLGKFDGKAEEGFLVGYSMNIKAFRVFNSETRKVEENMHVNFLENKPNVAGQGPKWLFDIDSLTNSMNYQPVTAGNQTNKNAGPQETNGDTGLKNDSTQQYIVFPLWSSISSSYKSSDEKHGVDPADDAAGQKNVQVPANENDQALKNVLGKMINQEKEALEQSDASKEYKAVSNRLLLRRKTDEASSTNSFNTVSTPVNTASASRTFGDAGPSSGPSFVSFDGSLPVDVKDYPDDPLMSALEDTTELQSTGIFNSAYDDDDFYNYPFDDQGMGAKADFNNLEPSIVVSPIPTTRVHSIHPKSQIIGDPKSAVQTMGKIKKGSEEQEELLQFKIQKVWTLVDLPRCKKAIGSKWVYRNKKDQRGLKQSGFVDPKFLEKVYKVEKALYGLHQAPRAWYETFSTYLLDNGFHRGQIDKTLFIKRVKGDILLVQVYVDDIIFGSTKKSLCDDFEQIMHNRFQMSSMGELTFFLGLQVKQKDDGIFISHDKSMIGSLMYLTSSRPDIMFSVCACSRFQVQPKVSHMYAVKRIFRYLKGQPKLGLWYPKDSPLILEAFSDNDYGGASLDRKSTTGAEYIAASHYCAQVLCIQNQLLDYGYNFMQTKIHIDNESTISVIKNLVSHSKTKHIEIRFHFIRDSYEKRLIEMVKIHTDKNVVDLLTKAFDVSRFNFLVASIGKVNAVRHTVSADRQKFVLLVTVNTV
ncbi:putative ribonuclease H-like domain-containing protein [Tanacetum coccineum]